MIFRTLGRTGLKVSLPGMGTGGTGILGQVAGRPRSESERLLRRAFELGINLFDTASGYMDSELILGNVLRGLPRDTYVLSTKVGVGPTPRYPSYLKKSDVVPSVENSLVRMGVDYVDLLLIGSSPELAGEVVSDVVPELEKLRDEGKIGFLGLTEASVDDGAHEWLDKALAHDVFDVVMVAHNMVNQSAKRSVFPTCKTKNVGVMNIFTVRRVFGNPVRIREVVGDLVRRGVVDAGMAPEHDPLGWLVSGDCDSVVEAAYRYAAYTDPVSTVMTGTIEVGQLEQNVKFFEKGPLPQAHVERLETVFGRVAEAVGN